MNYALILSIAGVIITLLLTVLGFVFKAFFGEHKDMLMEIGRLRGLIELNKQHAEDSIKGLNDRVELQIEQCTENINVLAANIKELLKLFIKINNKG